MQRIIREEEPPAPSTRLSTAGDRLTIIAKHRGVTPERLHKTIRGDLDWIVMKSLEKDRNRRYGSPASFAEEVARYLNNEPVTARPPTMQYRIRKYLRRNKLAVAVGTMLFTSLSLGLLGTGWKAHEAHIALAKANQALTDLESRTYLDLMEKALTGDDITNDLERLQHSIDELGELPNSPFQVHLLVLKGLVARNQARIPEAADLFKKAAELDKDSIHIQALSLLLLIMMGNEDEYARQLSTLQDKEPVLYEDKMLLANILTYSDPRKGLRLIQEAIKKRNSLYAHECLAEHTSHVAFDNTDLELADRAFEVARAVYTLEEDKPEFQMILLWTYQVRIQLRRMQGMDTSDLETEARFLADQLARYTEYPLGLVGAANFFERVGEEERAEKEMEASNRVSKGFLVVPYAAMKYRHGKTEEALQILREGKDHSMLADVAYAEAMAIQSPQDALQWYDTVKHLKPLSPSPRNQWIIPESVLLAGRDLKRARDHCQRRVGTQEYCALWERAALEFVVAESTDENLAKFFAAVNPEDARSQTQLMAAYKLAGMKYLAEGDMEKAIEYLRKARLETSAFYWPLAYWSEALARELERNRPGPLDRSDETNGP
jgi:tetratricopeptide (TPR) repeat protein